MRRAVYAGSFYPKTIDKLNQMIEECFTGKLGPGALPSKPRKDAALIQAVISPHAGYVYSGMAAAWGYLAIGQAPLPDVFIVLGPNHRSNESGIAQDSFETPLGFVRVDQEFAKELARKGHLKINDVIHAQEHSMEVQLPFLQFALGSRAEHIKILPILISDDVDLDAVASDLKAVIKLLKRKVTFIVSSDFTHYGRVYGYLPFTTEIRKRIYALDGAALDLIKKKDFKAFEEYVYKTGATICGQNSIALLLRMMISNKTLIEQYYTSGDLSGDYSNSVSYASIVFK